VEREIIKHGWASLSHQKHSQFPAYLFYVCIHGGERSKQITFIHPTMFFCGVDVPSRDLSARSNED